MNAIGNAIERYLVASRIREEDPFKKRKFYISDMGKCLRIRYLKRKGITSDFAKFVYWTFQLGDLIHDFGYKALEAQGLLVATEEYVEDEHFIGRFDGIVRDPKTDDHSLFDFKSANPNKMKKLVAGGDDGADDAMQVMTYVMLYKAKEPKKEISDVGTVVYINKEPSDRIEPTIALSKNFHLNLWMKPIIADMAKLVDFWNTQTIPPCTCPGWMKGYNSYLPFCEMPEKEVKAYLKLIDQGYKVVSTKEKITKKKGDL